MVSICFYFQVHQPYRLKEYSVFDIGNHDSYFDEEKNKAIMRKVAKKCYIPTNNLILSLIHKHKGKFKVSYSITGTAMEQFEAYAPEVLDSFRELAATGCVEFLSETYNHSLSYLFSKEEFKEQVKKHSELMKKHFGQNSKVFRNTELIYNNEIAQTLEEMGYEGVIAEGADHVLRGRSPNFLYKAPNVKNIKTLLKNCSLSDDIAFRFSNPDWEGHPLTAEKYVEWVNKINGSGQLLNLFMDYETFGEHQWEHTGIFRFLENLPSEVLKHPDNEFLTPTEVIEKYDAFDILDAHNFVSWADLERDLTAWLGNPLQDSSIRELYKLEAHVKKTGDQRLIDTWRKLTTSDHFYYMCTKWFADGDVHKYFNPYESPYEAYITFMNVLNDFVTRIKKMLKEEIEITAKAISPTPSMLLN